MAANAFLCILSLKSASDGDILAIFMHFFLIPVDELTHQTLLCCWLEISSS